MADLSWLTKAAEQKKEAQLKEFVALPLFRQAQQTFTELSGPVTPQAQGLLRMIEEHRRRNPAYIPFKPGTPTLQQKQLSESIKQWQAEFEEGKRRYEDEKKRWEKEFAEGVRRFNIQTALQRQAMARSSDGSGGVSAGSMFSLFEPKTETERRSYSVGSLMQKYQSKLDALWEKEGVRGEKEGYVKGPTVESVANELAKIEAELIKNLPTIIAQNVTPADVRNIFNTLITNGLGIDGKKIYEELKQKHRVTFDLESVLQSLENNSYFSTE